MADDQARRPDTTSGPPPDASQTSSELSFSGFVIGLAQQVLLSLGLAPEDESGAVKKDLAHAKVVIDIIVMLREKTRGNLDEVETRLVDEMLDELRIQYVRETRGSRQTEGSGS
jgi:hypothetical protein